MVGFSSISQLDGLAPGFSNRPRVPAAQPKRLPTIRGEIDPTEKLGNEPLAFDPAYSTIEDD